MLGINKIQIYIPDTATIQTITRPSSLTDWWIWEGHGENYPSGGVDITSILNPFPIILPDMVHHNGSFPIWF